MYFSHWGPVWQSWPVGAVGAVPPPQSQPKRGSSSTVLLQDCGTPCIDLDHTPAAKKEIACTRSFGRAVTELDPLKEAVTEFASRTAEKLRKQHSLASQVLVFIRTSPFRPGAQYSRSLTVPLRRPTADTAQIVQAALMG